MSISSDSAEQTIRLTLEGMEVVAKISGMAVKNIAVALYTISQDKKKTRLFKPSRFYHSVLRI